MLNSGVADHPPAQTSLHSDPGNSPWQEVRLRCPCCAMDIAGVECPHCAFRLETRAGIVRALPPQRIAHYARFIAEYDQIRAAEGRGSQGAGFYLDLPYRDLSGKNAAQWRIRARSYDHLFRHVLRPNLPTGTRILDLGAGNCWTSFRLARAGYSPVAVDLLTTEGDGLGAAVHYGPYLPVLFPRFQAELTRLPFQGGQFDAVIFNASFHYTEDAEIALREALRCTRPGGMVVISDTPWYSREESGRQMVAERRAAFIRKYGTASDSIDSFEYLTDERLGLLAKRLSIVWSIHSPRYGLRWALRPFVARLRRRREPSRFRIYVARKEPA